MVQLTELTQHKKYVLAIFFLILLIKMITLKLKSDYYNENLIND